MTLRKQLRSRIKQCSVLSQIPLYSLFILTTLIPNFLRIILDVRPSAINVDFTIPHLYLLDNHLPHTFVRHFYSCGNHIVDSDAVVWGWAMPHWTRSLWISFLCYIPRAKYWNYWWLSANGKKRTLKLE